MTTLYVNSGQTVEHTAGATIASGEAVVIGDCVGIALAGAASGAGVTLALAGRFTVPKVTGTAWSQGDKLDYDESTGKFAKGLSSAIGDVTDCAIAAVDAGSDDATGDIILMNPGTVDTST
jgi:predicted RecA/RadA family phage recombinase